MSFLYSVFNVPFSCDLRRDHGGDERNRTADPLLARQVLSQLSYTPISQDLCLQSLAIPPSEKLVGSNGLEPSTSRLSGVRSNHLSYEPIYIINKAKQSSRLLLRKEVIQPHLPIRLPCYDFTPIIDSTFDCCLYKLAHRLRVFPTLMV